MRKLVSLDQHARLLIAAVSASAAFLIASVLASRLPHATAPLAGWWTAATWLTVGGLFAIAVGVLRDHLMMSPAATLGLSLVGAGVTTLAVMATTHHAGSAHLVIAWALSASSFTAVIGDFARCARSRPLAALPEVPLAEAPVNPASPGEVTLAVSDDLSTEDGNLEASISLPAHIQQTTSRYVSDGRDCLETCLRIQFEPGQQTAIVHVPIQPAMHSDPDVECEPASGDDVRITVDPAQPYGIRLVCRRSAPWTNSAETVVAVLVSCDRLAAAA